MTREEKILKGVDKSARGVEIGPSHIKLENIEEVDFVWRGERYPALVGERNAFSWIIASHVIEHIPDIVAFLEDCEALLSDTGVLSLAVPDKRFCFDHFRPISGLARILDCHYSGSIQHTPGSVVEFMLNAVSKVGQIGWSQARLGDFAFLCELDSVRAHLKQALEARTNIDVHAWCFTPASFRLLIHDLNLLGLTTLQPVYFFSTEGNEFFIALSKTRKVVSEGRLILLQEVLAEAGVS